MSDLAARPKLTMPEAEEQALRDHIAKARVILEYGSGGSTAIAAENQGKLVFSVESDAAWADNMRIYFTQNPPQARLHLHYANIGPTKAWGHPKDDTQFRKWPSYPLDVWKSPSFEQPELVLIDGRFRVACFLATLFCSKAPVTVLFDDYLDRVHYHSVEEFVPVAQYYGRMARFDVTPMAIPQQKLGWVFQQFLTTL
jgi:hypothetical protein